MGFTRRMCSGCFVSPTASWNELFAILLMFPFDRRLKLTKVVDKKKTYQTFPSTVRGIKEAQRVNTGYIMVTPRYQIDFL